MVLTGHGQQHSLLRYSPIWGKMGDAVGGTQTRGGDGVAAVGGRRRPVTTAVAPQGGRWSAPARSEALLAVVRATTASVTASVALALDGTGTGMASLLLLPVAVSMASLCLLYTSDA